jgi:hypothetical protein
MNFTELLCAYPIKKKTTRKKARFRGLEAVGKVFSGDSVPSPL